MTQQIRRLTILSVTSSHEERLPMTLTVSPNANPTNSTGRRRLDAATQVAVLGALWSGYAAVRHLTGDTQQVALGNAARLLDVESALGVNVEGILQSAVAWPQIFVAANAYYLIHFPLTLALMALAYWQRRTTIYGVLRNSLIGSTLVALLLHLAVPMAPPRMLPGFIDAGAAYGPDPYAIAGSDSANQFAAMPSLHVAWAVLAGYTLWSLSSRRFIRGLAILHPLVTSLVVIITGHHFVTDVAIGAVLAAAFVGVWHGHRVWIREPLRTRSP